MLGEGGGVAARGSISKGGPQTEAQDIFSVASILFYTWLHVKLLMHILADVMSLCAWDNSRSRSVSPPPSGGRDCNEFSKSALYLGDCRRHRCAAGEKK